jgi:hypothetical protein
MAYSFELHVEETLPGFVISPVAPHPYPLCVINENAPAGLPDRIIKRNQSWTVGFKWRVEGPVSDAMGPFNWRLSVHLLKLDGSGGVTWSQSTNEAYRTGVAGADDYDKTISVAAGAVPDGLYKLYASIDVQSPAIVPVTMMGDGPMMKFYTP